MNDITPQTIADRLQQLAAQMLDTADQMDYFGGFSLIGQHGKHLADAAVVAQSWADGIREDYPAEDDSALEQPTDRSALQAAGTHPAPCARHCESNAYQIEIRRISAERDALAARLDELERQEPVAWIYDWQAPEGPIRDWVTTNRAEIPEHTTNIRPLFARPAPAEQPVNARLTDEWISIADAMPSTQQQVDIAYIDHHGKRQTTMGWHCQAKMLEASSFGGEVEEEYDEETDTYYLKEQWVDESQESEYHYPITGVTHWKPRAKHPDFNPQAKGD